MFESTLEKISRIISEKYNLKVVFKSDKIGTDGKIIYLPSVKDITPEIERDLHSFLDREVSRCLFTDFKKLPYTDGFHEELTNIMDTFRAQNRMIDRYPGTEIGFSELYDKMSSTIDPNSITDEAKRFLYHLECSLRDKDTSPDKDTQNKLNTVKPYIEQLLKLNSTDEVFDMTKSLSKLLGYTLKSSSSKKPDSMMGVPMFSKGKGDSKGKGKKETALDNFMKSELSKSLKKGSPGEGCDPYLKYAKSGKDVSVPYTTEYDTVTDHSGKGDIYKYANILNKVKDKVRPIQIRLEKVLQVRENKRTMVEQEYGRINRRALSSMVINPSYRGIFKREVKTQTRNIAVEILIDLSGSMGGERIQVAKETAIALANALKGIGINFEVTGFNSVDNEHERLCYSDMDWDTYNRFNEKLDLHVFKSFGAESLTGLQKIRSGYNNPDGECVWWAAKRLSAQPEQRKILIVISDGQPAAEGDHNILGRDLKRRVKLLDKSGIECIGIGIQTDAVKKFYPDSIVVNNLNDFCERALAKLEKLILKKE